MQTVYLINDKNSFQDFKSMLDEDQIKLVNKSDNIWTVEINKEKLVVEIDKIYLPQLEKSSIDDVVSGKDKTENIVNISIKNNTVHIFQEVDGRIHETKTIYKHWVLSPNYHEGCVRLKGDQHFRYIKEYESIEAYLKVRNNVYNNGYFTVAHYPEAFMVKNGYTYFKGMKKEDVSLLSFDIETSGLDPWAEDAEVYLITNTYRSKNSEFSRTFCVNDYDSQYDMIQDWGNWVVEINPSVVLGHNIVMFDLPYLNVQAKRGPYGDIPFGRDGSALEIENKSKPRELRKDGSQSYSYQRVNIFGREVIDTFFLAIKADIARKYESYGLKSIIKQEGLEEEGRVHYPAAQIKDNWNNLDERKKIIAYAEADSRDPIKLYDLMIAPFFYLTPYIPKTFQIMLESATGSQINSLMVRSYLQNGYSVAKGDEKTNFEGAISFGNEGIHRDVYKVDVASLYPSIMRHYKIFPEKKDFNKNFIGMLEYFTLFRLDNKRKAKETGDRYFKDLEQAIKVVINSCYGFMGASGLNYNYPEGAALVTKYGRRIITKAVNWATRKGFAVANCDTDSISFSTGRFLSKDDRASLLKEINSMYPQLIKFEDDGYFKTVIILAAKNYILQSEDGKVKLKGSGLRDQKKEPALKEMLGEVIKLLLDNKLDLVDTYHRYVKEALNPKDISRWATKKTVTKPVLNCATDPTARLNERKVYDAIKNIHVQEGDKVYLYPAILAQTVETKQLKNGKTKEKVIKETGLKLVQDWNNDHDSEKLIERVYATLKIVSSVLDMTQFIDYTLIKNKHLLQELINETN